MLEHCHVTFLSKFSKERSKFLSDAHVSVVSMTGLELKGCIMFGLIPIDLTIDAEEGSVFAVFFEPDSDLAMGQDMVYVDLPRGGLPTYGDRWDHPFACPKDEDELTVWFCRSTSGSLDEYLSNVGRFYVLDAPW